MHSSSTRFFLIPVVEETVDSTHQNFHNVLEEKDGKGSGIASTHIAETERRVFASTLLNLLSLAAIVVDHIQMRDRFIPSIQIFHTLGVVCNPMFSSAIGFERKERTNLYRR